MCLEFIIYLCNNVKKWKRGNKEKIHKEIIRKNLNIIPFLIVIEIIIILSIKWFFCLKFGCNCSEVFRLSFRMKCDDKKEC